MARATSGLTADELARRLDDLAAGRVAREDVLADPAAAELREIVGIVAAIRPPTVPGLDPAVRARQRRDLLAAISASGPARRFNGPENQATPSRFSFFRALRPGLAFGVSLVVAASALTGGTVYAARDALPGDSLYAVKTAAERVQLSLATSDADRVRLYLDLADRRLAEIERAQRDKRPEAAATAARALADDLASAKQSYARAEATADAPALAALLADHLARTGRELAAIETAPAADEDPALAAARQEAEAGIGRPGGPVREDGPTAVAGPLASTPATPATATPASHATSPPRSTPASGPGQSSGNGNSGSPGNGAPSGTSSGPSGAGHGNGASGDSSAPGNGQGNKGGGQSSSSSVGSSPGGSTANPPANVGGKGSGSSASSASAGGATVRHP
jgi:uncharacterized membrane protein YgcG